MLKYFGEAQVAAQPTPPAPDTSPGPSASVTDTDDLPTVHSGSAL